MAKYKKVRADELKVGDVVGMDYIIFDMVNRCPYDYHDVKIISAESGFDELFERNCIKVRYEFFDQDRVEQRSIEPDKIMRVRVNPPTKKELETWEKHKQKDIRDYEEFRKQRVID